MAKKRTFAAKLAHEMGTEGKVICPNCNIEIKRVKLVLNKKTELGKWAPRYRFQNLCKCNEDQLFAEK